MSAFSYTAKRRIVAGHTEDAAYDIDIVCDIITPQLKTDKTVHMPWEGPPETVLRRVDEYRSIVTSIVTDGSHRDQIQEFLYSVCAGETFTFDEKGTVASPVNPVSAVLDGDHSEVVTSSRGLYKYSFKILLV